MHKQITLLYFMHYSYVSFPYITNGHKRFSGVGSFDFLITFLTLMLCSFHSSVYFLLTSLFSFWFESRSSVCARVCICFHKYPVRNPYGLARTSPKRVRRRFRRKNLALSAGTFLRDSRGCLVLIFYSTTWHVVR